MSDINKTGRNHSQGDDMDLKELEQRLGIMLDEYDVEYPGEREMLRTIEAIRPFVPDKENKWESLIETLSSILKQSLNEFFYINPFFWIANSVFILLSLSAVLVMEQNPYMITMIFAPLPLITGLFEILKSRDTGMDELEMSLKFSLQEIILSRMVVVGGYNFLINVIMTIGFAWLNPDIWFWKLVLYWVTPFTVISLISLGIVSKFRNLYAVTATVLVWSAFGITISQTQVIEQMESIPVTYYIVVSLLAAILILIKMIHLYKRGIRYEFDH